MEESKKRKEGTRRGLVTQRMMSFRIDIEVAEWLSQFGNKGRKINELLREAMTNPAKEIAEEIDPASTRSTDIMP